MESIQSTVDILHYDECQSIPKIPTADLQSTQHIKVSQTLDSDSQNLTEIPEPAHHSQKGGDTYREEKHSPELVITKLHRSAPYPIRRAGYGNAKFYLLAPYTIRVPSRSSAEVFTCLSLVTPPGYKYDITTRTKLSHKYKVHAISTPRSASPYVLDHLKVTLYNSSNRSVCIPRKKQFATLTIYKLASDVQLYLD